MIYRWYVKDALLFKNCTYKLIQGQNKICKFGSDKFTSGIQLSWMKRIENER